MSSSQKDASTFVAPNGCFYCGEMQHFHGMRMDRKKNGGLHRYVAPSNEIRLERMKANRALGLRHMAPYRK